MLITSVEVIKKLKAQGHEAYWAGGAVRDFLMGREPVDYDIVTSAKPDEIEAILENTIPIGKKFGVILAIEGDHHFEVATFRSDAAYSDGRRPDAVYFSNPEQDAKRRDFTVNGMFYDPIAKKVLDFVGGQNDLNNKILRFIGNADDRIKEDNLRLLRAIRFKNSLGFKYAPGTLGAIRKNAKLINKVSSERISEELTKILVGPGRGQALRDMDKTGILEQLLPEVCKLKGVQQPEVYHQEGDVFKHTIMALESLPEGSSAELVWAVLLHDIGKPDTFTVADRIRFNQHAQVGGEIVQKIGKRLNFSNTFTGNVQWLVTHHMILVDILKMKKTRQARWMREPLFGELLELLRADSLGTIPTDLSVYDELKKLAEHKEILLPMPPKLLTGDEIMDIFGLPQGPKVGELLDAVHEYQMDEIIKTKSQAIALVKKLLKQ